MNRRHRDHSSQHTSKLWVIFLCIVLLLLLSVLIPMFMS
jgi:hypothetical protein